MDDDLSNIRDRQDRLEGRVTHLEAKVDFEAGQRAKMDNDQGTVLAKLNAHEKSLSALRESQKEQGEELKEHGKVLKDHTKQLTEIKQDLVTVKVGVHAILDLLDANLAKRGLATRLSGRFTRRRDGDTANG
jgi:chromosome segregation ATPase